MKAYTIKPHNERDEYVLVKPGQTATLGELREMSKWFANEMGFKHYDVIEKKFKDKWISKIIFSDR